MLRFLAVSALSLAFAAARAETVYNPEFLRTLPRITASAELDRFIEELRSAPDPKPIDDRDWSLYRIKPFKGGYTALLLEDAGGKLTKHGVWLAKAPSGRFDRLVLVTPEQTDILFSQEGRIPFDARLKKKILKAKGLTNESELAQVMKGIDVSNESIMLLAVVTGDLLGHYMPGTTWLDADGQPTEVRGTPHKIWTRLEPDGRRIAITEQQFAETTRVAKTKPRINWTVERYAIGAVVDPRKLLREGDAPWYGTRNDPEIEALYQQLLRFTSATTAVHNAPPKAIIRVDSLRGSRLELLQIEQ